MFARTAIDVAHDAAPSSGVTDPAPFTFNDGSNLSHGGITVTDVAGNTSAATAGFTGIDQDTVAPTLSESISSPDAVTLWYNIASGPAVVTYVAHDAAPSSGVMGAVRATLLLTNSRSASTTKTVQVGDPEDGMACAWLATPNATHSPAVTSIGRDDGTIVRRMEYT